MQEVRDNDGACALKHPVAGAVLAARIVSCRGIALSISVSPDGQDAMALGKAGKGWENRLAKR